MSLAFDQAMSQISGRSRHLQPGPQHRRWSPPITCSEAAKPSGRWLAGPHLSHFQPCAEHIYGRLKMGATRYFMEQVLRKRPYLPTEQFDAILATPLRRSQQPDGRIRHWGMVTDLRDGQQRALRIVTLDDGTTVHNAFFDRGYRETMP